MLPFPYSTKIYFLFIHSSKPEFLLTSTKVIFLCSLPFYYLVPGVQYSLKWCVTIKRSLVVIKVSLGRIESGCLFELISNRSKRFQCIYSKGVYFHFCCLLLEPVKCSKLLVHFYVKFVTKHNKFPVTK